MSTSLSSPSVSPAGASPPTATRRAGRGPSGTQLLGTTHLAEDAEVGPNTRLTDTTVHAGA
ncbi:hypothetical protein, partial [Streptomyces sp. NPDC005167]